MEYYYKAFTILALFGSIEIFASQSPHITSIKLSDGSTHEIKSAYPLYSLTEEERKQTVFVSESCYAILKKDSSIKGAVVGPLYPCIFIAVHDPIDQQSIVLHHHEGNQIADIINLIKNKLDNNNKEKFIFHMFTKKIDQLSYKQQIPQEDIEQKKRFFDIFKALCAAFKPSANRFKALFYGMKTSLDVPSEYAILERCIYFSDNKTYSYPPLKEKLFRKKYTSMTLHDQIFSLKSDCETILLKYRPNHFVELTENKPLTFTDVSSRVGLDSLHTILNPPTHSTSSEEMD